MTSAKSDAERQTNTGRAADTGRVADVGRETDGRRERGQRRRRLLLDAAARVVARDGVAALTHRSAAAEAGLPKSAATYYFRDLDELLVAALLDSTEHYAADLAATIPGATIPGATIPDATAFDDGAPDGSVTDDRGSDDSLTDDRGRDDSLTDERGLAELAGHMAAYLAEHRDRCLAAYELYLLAARRPELREAALSWPRLARTIAARYTSDPAAITAFTAALDGLSMQALLGDPPLDAATLEAVLRRTLGNG